MADLHYGPTSNADGATVANGQDRTALDGSKVVTPIHGRRYEQASRGRVYSVMTAQAGVTLIAEMKQAPAATKQTVLSLVNPTGSNVNLEILLAWIAHISGTPAAGAWTWATGLLATPITQATTVVPVPGKVNGPASKGVGFSAQALTGGPAHGIGRAFPGTAFAGALVAGSAGGLVNKDDVDGAIVLQPGQILTLAPPDIGTNHVVCAMVEYAEVDITG
jgi:hypothetical protein